MATAGRVGLAGELDEWTFFGRRGQAVTVLVNPGTATQPAPVAPTLQWAEVRLLDAGGNVLASASNTQAGQVVTLNDVVLPADGTYRIQVRAAPGHTDSTGNYLVTLWDSTADDARLPLNERVSGRVESPSSVDRWRFAASRRPVGSVRPGRRRARAALPADRAGQRDRLHRPDGRLRPDHAARGGRLRPDRLRHRRRDRRLRLRAAVAQRDRPDAGHAATPARWRAAASTSCSACGSPTASPLRIDLDDSAAGNRNELYVRLGTPPTRSDSQYQSAAPAADQRVVVPLAAPGDWYVLVYTESAAAPSNFQSDGHRRTRGAGRGHAGPRRRRRRDGADGHGGRVHGRDDGRAGGGQQPGLRGRRRRSIRRSG